MSLTGPVMDMIATGPVMNSMSGCSDRQRGKIENDRTNMILFSHLQIESFE